MEEAPLMQAVSICSNFPIELMLGLRDRFGLQQFVETGTCKGGTASLAALAFPSVKTVEISPERYYDVCKKFAHLQHVSCSQNDSRDFLKFFPWQRTRPALIYLDAHCLPEDVSEADYGPGVAKPLADELKIIGSLYGKHCLVIDDFPLEAVRPMLADWDCFIFGGSGEAPGSYQFSVAIPEPCEYEKWIPLGSTT